MMKFAWLLPFLLLAGCAQDEFADLRAFLAASGQGTQQKLEPLPPVKTQEAFTYDPGELPDPFRPRSMKAGKGGGGVQPDLNRPKGPLEQDPLDGLRMVGTIEKNGKLYALVRRPDGTLYRVEKGDHIGQNHGIILAISDANIDIKEVVQDGAGDWTESKASMALQE
ncbi:MAG: pilus assembly protein PilP [Pseudomonadota bacterium]|nr:pilus assembly protein PilP [Pseudomonadota bacterium]MDP1904282.1 pilus assembly protein PilP [Pseudomonadota bacterium]MDP2351856.1 pilus assembly protein PilP [Pseudomonadota bacterium]